VPEILRPLETIWEDWLLASRDGGPGLAAAFVRPDLPLEVEIGPGEDDFLLECARAAPERNWLGIEYSSKRVERYVRRVLRLAGPLPNLRLAWRPAEDVIGPFLTPARVAGYHVHFPDPWPKKHHARYRLMDAPMVAALAKSLAPGGSLEVATDSRPYAEEMLAVLGAQPGLVNLLEPPGWREPPAGDRATVFERRWREMGRSIYALAFRRDATPLP
jgi:tRNA (guanine-N7-)-methyltransferase